MYINGQIVANVDTRMKHTTNLIPIYGVMSDNKLGPNVSNPKRVKDYHILVT